MRQLARVVSVTCVLLSGVALAVPITSRGELYDVRTNTITFETPAVVPANPGEQFGGAIVGQPYAGAPWFVTFPSSQQIYAGGPGTGTYSSNTIIHTTNPFGTTSHQDI